MTNQCSNCVYGISERDRIICRRFPPTVIPVGFAKQKPVVHGLGAPPPQLITDFHFPMMRPHDWCGEHRRTMDRSLADDRRDNA